MICIDTKNIYSILYRVHSDRSELDLSDETIGIQISISVESKDENTSDNYRNSYVAEKRSFQTIKDTDSKHWKHKIKS